MLNADVTIISGTGTRKILLYDVNRCEVYSLCFMKQSMIAEDNPLRIWTVKGAVSLIARIGGIAIKLRKCSFLFFMALGMGLTETHSDCLNQNLINH